MNAVTLDIAFMFAMAAAFAFACADMGMRSGLQHTDPFVGATMSRLVGVVALGVLAVAAGVRFPAYGEHYLWIAAAGVLNPGLFSIFFMFGIARIGVARAAPIKGSSPLFATILAIAVLGEQPAWYQLGGVLLIVTGIGLLSSGKTQGRWRRIDALWPLAAAVFSGLGAVLWRKALPAFPNSLAGTFVGMVAALAVTALYTVFFMRERIREGVQRAWKPFLLVGLVGTAGQVFFAAALQRGEVFRIIPLIQTSPLITVALALIFLRRVEFITWRVPTGALLTVGGAILINLRL